MRMADSITFVVNSGSRSSVAVAGIRCSDEIEEVDAPFTVNWEAPPDPKLAKKLGVAIPTSFFEKDGPHHYNTLAMIGPDGEIMGIYRKSHIPDGPGYEEKYYFRPGNTGFKVWDVFGTKIGVGVCWDQWYPEAARLMALAGAELLGPGTSNFQDGSD